MFRPVRSLLYMARSRNTALVLTAALAGASAGAAERPWVLARSRGFLVVSDAGEKDARQVAHQFEQVRGLFAQVLQARVDPGRPMMIFAVRDEDGLRQLLPGYWETKGGSRPAGIFIPGRDKLLVALRLDTSGEFPYHVIYHEYTHLLTRLNARWVPLWLSEGLAEFYGTADVDDKEVRWGRVFPPHVLYLRQASSLDIQTLMSADHSSTAYTHAGSTPAFYAQSAILTHYLLLGAEKRRGQVQQFLKLLEAGVDEPEARTQAFGDLRRLDSEVDGYVRRSLFNGLKSPTRIDPQAIQVAPLAPHQADMLRGDFLARTGRPKEARLLLESALRADPELSSTHEALGVLEENAGRDQAALARFAEAVRLMPANYIALFRAGSIADPSVPADKDAARREQQLRAAIAANGAFAPALSALARLLAGRPDRAEEAIGLARKACALDPAATSYRVALWNVLRQAGRTEDAGKAEQELLSVARRDRAALFQITAELESQDRVKDAEALLVKARAASPGSAMVATLMAAFLERHERAGEAVQLLRETLAADPQSLVLMNALAYALTASPGQAGEALTLIDKVLKKEPRNPSYLDTRGWALFRLKRLEEAETVLRAAAEGAGSGTIQGHLADVLRERGKTQEALAFYERALAEADLDDRERRDLEKKRDALKAPAGAQGAPASPKP
jgi:tetratricopeptide (TPR) repeat protein